MSRPTETLQGHSKLYCNVMAHLSTGQPSSRCKPTLLFFLTEYLKQPNKSSHSIASSSHIIETKETDNQILTLQGRVKLSAHALRKSPHHLTGSEFATEVKLQKEAFGQPFV